MACGFASVAGTVTSRIRLGRLSMSVAYSCRRGDPSDPADRNPRSLGWFFVPPLLSVHNGVIAMIFHPEPNDVGVVGHREWRGPARAARRRVHKADGADAQG